MSKFKKNVMVRHSPNVEGYVSVTSKKGERTEIKVTVPNESVRVLRTPNHWKTIYKDSKVRVRSCIASANSTYVMEGEKTFEFIFDNQRMRIDKGTLSSRRVLKINSAINKDLNDFNNNGNGSQ